MQRSILRLRNFHVYQKRYYKKDQVRVRFAPSPTGYLHLGGLRTALYNYLFARANNGSFILRIEDTDRTRIIPEAVNKLQDDLSWAGIISDEDPTRGGPAGPYLQSKRLELYAEQVEVLLKNGSAYRCYCTDHRLDLIRRDALKVREIPRYDNKCRSLTKEEVADKMQKGKPHCIRFKLASHSVSFDDLVYGSTSYNVAQNEGDPVIMKTDGYPTYHFANVVDDHFMQISHVLRGVEWLISTPKHIQLYQAFGWDPPRFAHLPLILNPDGTKLSKRQGDIRVDSYRQQGIFPLALLNFITQAGGGFQRKQEKLRCYSYETLIKQFDLSTVNVNSCRLMPEKLLEYNRSELSQLIENEKNEKFLVERVKRIVSDAFSDRLSEGALQLDEQHVIDVLKWSRDRISKLDDLIGLNLAFLWVVPSSSTNLKEYELFELLEPICKSLESENCGTFQKDDIKTFLKKFAENNNVPFSKLMKLLRVILSGLKEGPGVAEMMEILGKDTTLARLRRPLS